MAQSEDARASLMLYRKVRDEWEAMERQRAAGKRISPKKADVSAASQRIALRRASLDREELGIKPSMADYNSDSD